MMAFGRGVRKTRGDEYRTDFTWCTLRLHEDEDEDEDEDEASADDVGNGRVADGNGCGGDQGGGQHRADPEGSAGGGGWRMFDWKVLMFWWWTERARSTGSSGGGFGAVVWAGVMQSAWWALR